jgi:hypothetical protein
VVQPVDAQIGPAVLNALLGIAALAWRDAPRFTTESIEAAEDWGRFEGELLVRMLDDGRVCELLADYDYHRPDGSHWLAPVGAKVDGASIPPVFWSLIGGPFEGKYRNASVIHDYYCDSKTRPWRDTHRTFYEAMRCKGVGTAKAKVMYYAVYRFGPRWPDPGVPLVESVAAIPARAPTEAAAASLLADAEAIYTHDLSLDAIEHLADARETEAMVTENAIVLENVPDDRLVRARALVVCGGSGTPEDLEIVAREAALLPDYVLKRFERRGIRIVACRGSVTDFETDLRGRIPRGWESTGRTWDSVPGTYFQERLRVVIATVPQGAGRIVPTSASGLHGSDSLVVHESLHGFDYSGGHAVLSEQRFVDARNGDLPRLGSALNGYLVQQGQAGLEETFAESGARHAVDAAGMGSVWPHLAAYWQQGPGSIETAAPAPLLESAAAGADSIGTATIRVDGTIELDLRAEGPGGAIGHAVLTVAPGDPAHAGLRAHLLRGPVPESAGGEIKLPFLAN